MVHISPAPQGLLHAQDSMGMSQLAPVQQLLQMHSCDWVSMRSSHMELAGQLLLHSHESDAANERVWVNLWASQSHEENSFKINQDLN